METNNGDGRISEESAELIYNEFLEYYDIDPENDLGKAAEMFGKKMIRAFSRGILETEKDDRGRLFLIHHLRVSLPSNIETLRYKPLNANAKIAMQSGVTKKRGTEENTSTGDHERMYRLMASLANVEMSKIRHLEGADLGLVEVISAHFLAV